MKMNDLIFPQLTEHLRQVNQRRPRNYQMFYLLSLVLAEWLLVGSLSLLARLRGQRARGLLELNDALVTVLLTANLFGHRRRLISE